MGWSLFGGGLALWAVTRLAFPVAYEKESCIVIGWESSYYASAGLVMAGVTLGSYATAHRRYTARFGPRPTELTIVPTVSREFAGASISGRF